MFSDINIRLWFNKDKIFPDTNVIKVEEVEVIEDKQGCTGSIAASLIDCNAEPYIFKLDTPYFYNMYMNKVKTIKTNNNRHSGSLYKLGKSKW